VADRPLRFVQLVHGYPPAIGGVEMSVRDMCERLVREGFDVTVLTTDAYTVRNFVDPRLPTLPIDEGEVQNGVRVRRFPVRSRWARALYPVQKAAWKLHLPGNALIRTLYNGPLCPGMLKALRVADPDVVCAASFPLNHMRYPFMLGRDAPPVVLIPAIHTNDAWAFERPNLLRLVDRAYATVAHTEHERRWLLAHGAAPEKVRVIGHGFDVGELRPRPGAFRAANGIGAGDLLVAYVGQQAAHKGIDTLVEILPALLQQQPSAWLAICGSRTPYSDELRQLVAAQPAEASARVVVIDDATDQQKADLLGDCDVFASPSHAESFGITTLEAWSLGRPVVVGNSPSQSEIVEHGVDGFIVAHGDARQLLDVLVRLAAEPELRAAVARAGQEKLALQFGRHATEGRYVELFRDAAAGASGASPPRG
jgi:glycosyltransferase involved in cell wall biosynthesis